MGAARASALTGSTAGSGKWGINQVGSVCVCVCVYPWRDVGAPNLMSGQRHRALLWDLTNPLV